MSQPGPAGYGPGPAGYGPGGAGGAGGVLDIHSKFFPTAFMLMLTGVGLSIDGQEQQLKWGQQQVPIAPGPHHIEMWTRYMGKMGRATLPVNVGPGQRIPVFYASPASIFQAGAIGHQPVKVPGGTVTMIVSVVAIAILVLACLIPVLAQLAS